MMAEALKTEETKPEIQSELPQLLREHLTNSDCKKAVKCIYDEKYNQYVVQNGWDLISIITEFVNVERFAGNPEFETCCGILLQEIAEKSNPKEVLLGLLEQLEDYSKFRTLLRPIQVVLLRLPKQRGKSLEWALATICDYVAQMPLPEINLCDLEGEEKKLLDLDSNVRAIMEIYHLLTHFFKPFIDEVDVKKKNNNNETVIQQRQILSFYLLRLLAHPLTYLDLTDDGNTKGTLRLSAEDIMEYLSSILNDVCVFLNCMKTKKKSTAMTTTTVLSNADAEQEDVPFIALATYFYLLFAEKLHVERVPCVYSATYLLNNCVMLSAALMQKSDQPLAIEKGLLLASAVMKRIDKNSLGVDILELPGHTEFLPALSNIITFCESRDCRQLGILQVPLYVSMFHIQAKYQLIINMFNTNNNAGLLGFMVTHLKDIIAANFENTYFHGENLKKLLFTACHLTNGVETDLLQISEEIIPCLNLIRFLVLRDSDNVTGFWDMVPELQTKYLEPLRLALNISRAHYDLQRKENLDIKNQKQEIEVTLTVCGQDMPKMTPEAKHEVLENAIITFDFMQSLLGRVSECIEAHQNK